MINSWKSLLFPPQFDEAEKTRIARLTHISLFLLLLHIPLLHAIALLQGSDSHLNSSFLLANDLAHLMVTAGLLVALRIGYVYQAARMLAVWSWLVIVSIVVAQGGINSPLFDVIALVIVFSGLLTGRRGVLLFTIASLVFGVVIAFPGMTDSGGLNAFTAHERTVWVAGLLKFVIGGTFTYLAVTGLEEALNSAQENARRASETGEHLAIESEHRIRVQEQLQGFFDHSLDIIAICKPQGELVMVNPALEHVLGYTSDEAIGKPVQDFVYPKDLDRIETQLRTLVDGDSLENIAFRMLHKDGSHHCFSWTVFMFGDQIFGLGRDITTVRQLEAERIEIEARRKVLHMQEQFVSQVSHQFRTPLTIIQSSHELLERYYERMVTERRKEHLNQIRSQIDLLTEMVDQILLINKFNTGTIQLEQETVNLERFCRNLINEMQLSDEPVPQIVFTNNSSIQTADLDPRLLRHILMNLLSNAIKYTPADGQIRLQVEDGLIPNCVVLRVIDTGIGMSADYLPRLYCPFARARNAEFTTGTGLGLAIVKDCVDIHRGKIDVASSEGQGTTVTVQLPTILDSYDCCDAGETAAESP